MRRAVGVVVVLILAGVAACSSGPQPTYVRGSQVPGLDEPAMGLGLDERDLDQLFAENMNSMVQSPWFNAPATYEGLPTVAVLPMENATTEHIDSQLQALIGMVETELVNTGRFTVVSSSLRDEVLEELRLQQGVEFDASRAARVGRQLGIRYFVTGRVYDNAERSAEMRRVQYFMFMQSVDVETGAIVWQNQSQLTKGVVPM